MRPYLIAAANITIVCLRALATVLFCVLAFVVGFALTAIGVDLGGRDRG